MDLFLSLVPDDMRTAFAWDNNVFPTVPIKIIHSDLKTNARSFTRRSRGDEMFGPVLVFGIPVVVMNRHVVMGT